MVLRGDECPVCEEPGLTRAGVPEEGVSTWLCRSCGARLDEPHDARQRLPATDGDRDVRAASELAGRVRAFRVAAGLTPCELAARVGVHWSVITGVEHGQFSPPALVLLRISCAVGVDAGRLVAGLPAGLVDPSEIDLRDDSPHRA